MIASRGMSEKFLRQKLCGKCLEIIWKNMVEPERPQMSVYDNMAHVPCVPDN